MRIRITVPSEHVDADTLNPALEASTAVAQKQVESGDVPSLLDAIRDGAVKWKPEPERQGFEGFDLPADCLARGWGDCDDLAPWWAAELRHTDEDPDARAIVYKSGPRRYHAVVQRGDGSIDDPSRWAGMGKPGGPLPVTEPIADASAVGFKRMVSGATKARVDVPIFRTMRDGVVGLALERAGRDPYDALLRTASGALGVLAYWGAPDEVETKMHAIVHILSGRSEDDFYRMTGCDYRSCGEFVEALGHRVGATATFKPDMGAIADIAATIIDPLGLRNMIAPLATNLLSQGVAQVHTQMTPPTVRAQVNVPGVAAQVNAPGMAASVQGDDFSPDLYGADAVQKGCHPGQYFDGYLSRCIAIPGTSVRGDIPPDLYGADAVQKGCRPGEYWDGWLERCIPVASVHGDGNVHFYPPMSRGAFQDAVAYLQGLGVSCELPSDNKVRCNWRGAVFVAVRDDEMTRGQLLDAGSLGTSAAWTLIDNVFTGRVSGCGYDDAVYDDDDVGPHHRMLTDDVRDDDRDTRLPGERFAWRSGLRSSLVGATDSDAAFAAMQGKKKATTTTTTKATTTPKKKADDFASSTDQPVTALTVQTQDDSGATWVHLPKGAKLYANPELTTSLPDASNAADVQIVDRSPTAWAVSTTVWVAKKDVTVSGLSDRHGGHHHHRDDDDFDDADFLPGYAFDWQSGVLVPVVGGPIKVARLLDGSVGCMHAVVGGDGMVRYREGVSSVGRAGFPANPPPPGRSGGARPPGRSGGQQPPPGRGGQQPPGRGGQQQGPQYPQDGGQYPYDDGYGGYGPYYGGQQQQQPNYYGPQFPPPNYYQQQPSYYGPQQPYPMPPSYYGAQNPMVPSAPYAGIPGVDPFTGTPMIPGTDLTVDEYGGLATPTAFEQYWDVWKAEQPRSAFDGTIMTGDGPSGG